jgi:alpha-amylase
MNVLSDFKIRLNGFVPENAVENDIASLQKIILEKEAKIKKLEAEIVVLQKRGKHRVVKK